MDDFAQKEFETMGALRTNRIIFPNHTRQQAKHFAPGICKNDPNVSLVTVGKRSYYVYRYQGKMNGHDDIVVLLSYPGKAFGEAAGRIGAFDKGYNDFRNCVLQAVFAQNVLPL